MTVDKTRLLVERAWRSDVLDSTEEFTLVELGDGYRLAGRTRIAFEEGAIDLTYRVETSPDWLTRTVWIWIPEIGVDLDVQVEQSSWWVNGELRPDLGSCTDIDLGWTPATNTLPIRRASAEIDIPFIARAAWLRWPELIFKPADQTYTKRTNTAWIYQQGEFIADLEIDDHGVVITYGDPPIWYSV